MEHTQQVKGWWPKKLEPDSFGGGMLEVVREGEPSIAK